jgi:glycerol-3-phosphate dehydrogenase
MSTLSASQLARSQALDALGRHTWDVVVIGGGISGAGVAQQAARQGWRVLLLEQRDFTWGTSSRSSKLVHGGLRYLKEGDFKTTLHSVRERQRLMAQAPELVEAQSFLFALCTGRAPGRRMFQLGLRIYDAMAGFKNHFWATLAQTQALAPGLAPEHMHSALVYGDAKTDDARLVMRVLAEAQHDGATVLNYAKVEALHQTQGRVTGLTVHDIATDLRHTVQAKVVINATGVWADQLRTGLGAKHMLRPLRGSHVVLPFWRLPVAQSISLMHPRDGRPVFFYPWEGATLVGTTDLDYTGELHTEASITLDEVDYLLEAVNEQFPGAHIEPQDISACYAGVRPVVDDGKASASQAARDHVVCNDHGLITVTGGKLTTFRLMAQDALAQAASLAGKAFVRNNDAVFTRAHTMPSHWPAAVRYRLVGRYGARAAAWCQSAPARDLERIPGTDTLWVELAVAAQHEAVLHLDDLLLRRTRLGILLPRGGLDHLTRIQALCETHLQWGAATWATEIDRYQTLIAKHYQLPHTAPVTSPTPSAP